MQKKESTIIGAGLVGSLLSIYLSKRGYKVTVYERRGDMNINRSVTANSIVDSRTNRLTRYFIATFTYRLQRFAGQPIQTRGVDFRRMAPPTGAPPQF